MSCRSSPDRPDRVARSCDRVQDNTPEPACGWRRRAILRHPWNCGPHTARGPLSIPPDLFEISDMAQVRTVINPEAYYIGQGELVPNNPLPALVYRNVLPRPISRESAQALCEGNQWEKRVSGLLLCRVEEMRMLIKYVNRENGVRFTMRISILIHMSVMVCSPSLLLGISSSHGFQPSYKALPAWH